MKFFHLIIICSLLIPKPVVASNLPDLGDVSQSTITPRQERQIGLQIMRQIRDDPSYLDDPEIASYLNNLGYRLISNSNESAPGQSFEFFALQDSTINAFALPGGFMGFNSGLIMAAQSESELASVMAHEIAHVTQKHLARMLSGQKYSLLTSLASIALAIIASRANPEAGQAVLVASQASAIQSQLDFTRKHEKEADRVGFNILLNAGFDPQGMSAFFGRLEKASRFYENSAPSYLRTHPITHERIADIQNRAREVTYRQVPDSIDFLLVRAKVRALHGKSRHAVTQFASHLKDKRYANEAVERYGFINALLRDKQFKRAEKELDNLYGLLQPESAAVTLKDHQLGQSILIAQKDALSGAMIETLAAKVKLSVKKTDEALKIYRKALKVYPQHRALIYGYATALFQEGKYQQALRFVEEQLQHYQNDLHLYKYQARSYTALGNDMLKHRAQAEIYILQGHYVAAIDQLQIALKHDNGNFYQLSTVEARLKQLKAIVAEQKDD